MTKSKFMQTKTQLEIYDLNNRNNYSEWIGKSVVKKSGKPFKSGNKVNTVIDVVVNPNTNRVAFVFSDDYSVVDAHICVLVD